MRRETSAETGVRAQRVGQLRHLAPVLTAQFSVDGGLLLTGSADKSAQLWNVETGVVLHRFEHLGGPNALPMSEITAVAISHDARLAATAGAKTVRISGPAGGAATLAFADAVREAAGKEPLQRFATVGDIRLWDIRSGSEVCRIHGPEGLVTSLAFSQDGRSLAAGGVDQVARIWSVDTQEQSLRITPDASSVSLVSFCPRSQRLLVGTSQGLVCSASVSDESDMQFFRGHSGPIRASAFSADGRYLLTGSADKSARLWDVCTRQELHCFQGHSAAVTSVAFGPGAESVSTASVDGTVCHWHVAKKQHDENAAPLTAATTRRHPRDGGARFWQGVTIDGWTVTQVARASATEATGARAENSTRLFCTAFSPDLKSWVTGDEHGEVAQLSMKSGEVLRYFGGHLASITVAALPPEGGFLVTASDDATARIWNRETGRELAPLVGHVACIDCVAVSSDGTKILTGSQDATARSWDVATGRQLRKFDAGGGPVRSVAFSPDGKRMLVGARERTVLFDAIDGREISVYPGQERAICSENDASVWSMKAGVITTWHPDGGKARSCLATTSFGTDVGSYDFSPEGDRLVAASPLSSSFRVYDVGTLRRLYEFQGHTDSVNAVLFSHDGRLIASSSDDGTTRVWDAATGNQVHCFESGASTVCDFCPTGRRLLIVANGEAIIWDFGTGEQISYPSRDQRRFCEGYFLADGEHAVLSRGVMPPDDITIWDTITGKQVQYIDLQASRGHTGKLRHVAISPTQRRLAMCYDGERRVVIWDCDQKKKLYELEHTSEYAAGLRFSPDGNLLVASGSTTSVWNADTGRAMYQVEGFLGQFVAGGRKFTTKVFHFPFSVRHRSKFCLWDAKTGNRLADFPYTAFPGHFGGTTSFTVSPDGRSVVTTGNDSTVRVWDTRSGETAAILWGHAQPTQCSIFFPDGRHVATGSWDGTVIVWNIQDGTEICRYPHTRPVLSLSVGGDGQYLATATSTGAFVVTCQREILP